MSEPAHGKAGNLTAVGTQVQSTRPSGIDVEALAEKVYRLWLEDVRLYRARSASSAQSK